VRVVLVVLIGVLIRLPVFGGIVMANRATDRGSDESMMPSDVAHDATHGRAGQAPRLCAGRDAQAEANEGNDQKFRHIFTLSDGVGFPMPAQLSRMPNRSPRISRPRQ
jgi:hypothetical protein